MSKVINNIAELVYPTRCVGCDKLGCLLCDECLDDIKWINQMWACPVCGAPWGWLTCTECKRDWILDCCVSACLCEGVAKKMVVCMKDKYELRLAAAVASGMAMCLDEASFYDNLYGYSRFDVDKFDCISFVPATASAYARRGFDHMEIVSGYLSSFIGLDVYDVLVRKSKKDQRGLSKTQRSQNVYNSVCTIDSVKDMNILLADDIITTGASMKACANVLLQAGAKSVSGVSFCRTL